MPKITGILPNPLIIENFECFWQFNEIVDGIHWGNTIPMCFSSYICGNIGIGFLVIVVFKHFFYRNCIGLSFWPFVIVKEDAFKKDGVLINHERIHLRQQRELLVFLFYVWYLTEWLCVPCCTWTVIGPIKTSVLNVRPMPMKRIPIIFQNESRTVFGSMWFANS